MSRSFSRRTALSLLGGTAFAWGLAACRTPEPAAGDGPPVIRWGYFRIYQPTYIGIEKGFFRDAGVDVRITGTFNSGPAVVQAAGTGQIDAGHSAITGIAGAVAAGVRVSGIADSQTEFFDAPLQQWFVLTDSGINSVADLRGKRIGTNALSGSFFYTMSIALAQAGLKDEDVRFVSLSHDRQGQALLEKQIDVAGLIDPYSIKLAKEPTVRRLFSGVQTLGEKQFSLIFFSDDFIAAHPEAVRAFMVGYVKAIDFIRSDPEESSALMATKLGLEATDVVPHRYTDGATVRPADVQFWIDAMRAHGELGDAPQLVAADLLDTSFTA